MRVRSYRPGEVASFVAVAWPLLAADPARHTLPLTALDGLYRGRAEPAPGAGIAAMLTVHDGAALVGALLRTAGRPAQVSAVRPAHAGPVEAALAGADPGCPGVTGPVDSAEAMAAAHASRTGGSVRVDLRLRLFGLAALTPPTGVAGAARPAGAAELDLVADWMREFRREALHHLPDPPPAGQGERPPPVEPGRLLWVVDGRPVALAAARRPVVGMSRIGPVYTPPAHRGRGFGAAVTAAATRWALGAGARQVVMFVDQANPTSNRLYRRLGFRPRFEVADLSFVPAR